MDVLLIIAVIGFLGWLGYDKLKEWDQNQQWKHKQSLAKWRQLKKGMSESEVKKIIGDPINVTVADAATVWEYQFKGTTNFMESKLIGWQEPKQ